MFVDEDPGFVEAKLAQNQRGDNDRRRNISSRAHDDLGAESQQNKQGLKSPDQEIEQEGDHFQGEAARIPGCADVLNWDAFAGHDFFFNPATYADVEEPCFCRRQSRADCQRWIYMACGAPAGQQDALDFLHFHHAK